MRWFYMFTPVLLCLFLQDILYICNKCGPVQRIVIFGKNRVQAMVEYPFESIHAWVRLDIFILSLHHRCQPQWHRSWSGDWKLCWYMMGWLSLKSPLISCVGCGMTQAICNVYMSHRRLSSYWPKLWNVLMSQQIEKWKKKEVNHKLQSLARNVMERPTENIAVY